MTREHDFSSSRTLPGAKRVKSSRPLLRFLRSAVFTKYIQEEVFTHSISALLHFRFSPFFFSSSSEDHFGVYDASESTPLLLFPST